MEGFNPIPQVQEEGVEKMSNLEKKRELAGRIKGLHDHFLTRIKEVFRERNAIFDKYKGVVENMHRLRPADYMSPEDLDAYRSTIQEETDFGHNVAEVIREAVELLSEDENAGWERKASTGVPGSLSQTNSRQYRSKIDDTYDLEVRWYNYPEDDGHVPDSFRESYSASIVGAKEVVVKKGLGGIGRKTEKKDFSMTTLGVEQNDEREFEPNKELEAFDEPTKVEFQERLLELSKRLREQLG